ncbi:UNVERIFIED_CONTAM: hypothetical protein K2H54_047688 [Gekko kuhli]
MRKKLKIMTHQVDQLKEEITAKEAALVKVHLEHQRIEKEKEALKLTVSGKFSLVNRSQGEGIPFGWLFQVCSKNLSFDFDLE